MRLVDPDGQTFILSYLVGRRQEPEVRAALISAVCAAYDRRLELPDWLLDLAADDEPDDEPRTFALFPQP